MNDVRPTVAMGVETLQEITATDDKTLIAVEITGRVDLTKATKR